MISSKTIVISLLTLVGGIFSWWIGHNYFSEAARWRIRFEAAIELHGQARLSELVDFEWDIVYLLESFDLTPPLREEIFGPNGRSFGWNQWQKYWTIIYRRFPEDPLVIRMTSKDWSLNRMSLLRSDKKSATLRQVNSQDAKQSGCVVHASRGKCIILEE